jgi:prephenate dehydrogenase
MGRLFARLFQGKAKRIIACSRNPLKIRSKTKLMHIEYGGHERVSEADIAFVTVPTENTYEVCTKILKLMKKNSLLVDISSVKTGIADTIVKELPTNISYISIHPLFGPQIRQPKGENVLIIPAKEDGWLSCLVQFFKDLGCNTTVTTVEKHDHAMAVVQVLHHLTYLSFVEAYSKLAPEIEIDQIQTRSFRKTRALLASLAKNLDAILTIQRANPNAQSIRKKYAEVVMNLCEADKWTIAKFKREFDKLKVR